MEQKQRKLGGNESPESTTGDLTDLKAAAEAAMAALAEADAAVEETDSERQARYRAQAASRDTRYQSKKGPQKLLEPTSSFCAC